MVKRPLTLVIVDGHDGARMALAARLQRTPGVQVLAAVGQLDTAGQVVGDLVPDAVLLEPRTVDGNPVAALRRLVSTGLPIVIVTSSLVSGEAEAFVRAGAAAVLVKGSDLPGLLWSIEAAITAQHEPGRLPDTW
jgi:DNA-binding NarL/FixJ family response regulator